MIKFVDLEPSIAATPQRRSNPYGGGSVIGTPDMSSSARSKGLWSNGGRFSATTTPLHHPAYQFQQQQLQRQMSGGGASKRYSGGSTISSGSIVDDYFARSFSMEQNGNVAAPAAPIGLGLTGIDRPVEQSSMERFLSTSPMNTPPAPTLGPSSTTSSSFPYNSGPAASPLPFISSPSYHQQQFYMRSPLSTPSSATFFPAGVMMEPNQGFHSHHHPQRYLHHRSSLQSLRSSSNGSVSSGRLSRAATVTPTPTPATPPPPMGPLPPLPKNPTCTYREHTKQKLLDFNRRPTHARTNSHGFVIENVGQFLKKKSYSKALTRDYMSRGHRRRGSM
ncbi:hypothetical protein BCR41DRAFT_392885 [Lobosporangium transversale]|uniref:Uncharacterized protein n=1 Tax=Lobosporangium transversale TaxID=64571 RepID=A0A1Y2GX38_9FUNG|nr:hypothetical protein BCR41DRAFT_392885 [Lobosporangium transversale]ORZ26847.1 hypothetical protein BCR41DRAFT_392885 [Lobosporangium transversale]|eukprot:XP_021884594.1 hypothetical protein BCR41DRAFT_392885 [Lobosporangium transversale]